MRAKEAHAMLRTLQTIAAMAVIAFWIGFMVGRYPLVWDKIGTKACIMEETHCAAVESAAQLANSADSSAFAPSGNPVEPPLAESRATTGRAIAQLNAQYSLAPIGAAHVQSPRPEIVLVPVPKDYFTGDGLQSEAQHQGVRRLPPVCDTMPIAENRYTAGYPQTPIPIYPSTGVE
jgi:hypothetical protein